MAMTKTEIICKLEGRIITTADGCEHVIEDGAFTTKSGALVRLVTLEKFHLRTFLENAK